MGLPFTKYWGGLKQKVPKVQKNSREDFENKKSKVTRITLENKKRILWRQYRAFPQGTWYNINIKKRNRNAGTRTANN